MQKRTILLGTLALVVVVAAIGGVAYVLHSRAQANGHTCAPADGASYLGLHAPVCVVCPGPPYGTIGQGPFQGRPYRPGQGLPTIRPRNDCTPSFTQQDVRDYVVAHGVPLGMLNVQIVGQPTVTRVIFLTIRDLGSVSSNPEWASFGSSMVDNYPLDMLVCYAGLSGTFIFRDSGGQSTDSAAFITFDAHTGNELVTGLGAPFS